MKRTWIWENGKRVGNKTCAKCLRVLDVSAFRETTRNQIQSRCIECVRPTGKPRSRVADGKKACTACGDTKPVEEFYSSLDKSGKRYPCPTCKDCAKTRHRADYNEALKAEVAIPDTKVCAGCRTEKSTTEFHRSIKSKDRRVGRCKPCQKEYARRFEKRQSETRRILENTPDEQGVTFQSIRDEVLKSVEGLPCCWCLDPKAGTVDHVCPLSVRVDNSSANLVPACLSCQTSRRNRTVAQWKAFLKKTDPNHPALTIAQL